MSEAILVAFISGGLSLIGVYISNLALAKKSEKERAVAQAVTDTKLDELTREVREHNNFAKRVPLLEQKMATVEANIKELQSLHERQ